MIVNVEQIDPYSLPSVTLGQRDQLPSVSGIYFAILDAEILYIGRSINIQQRWRWEGHHRANQLQSLGNVIIAWFPFTCLDEKELGELEEECIEHFKPTLNGIKIPDEFEDYITMRVWKQTRKKLRLISALTEESIVETLDRLASEELQRIEAKKDTETRRPEQD